MLKVIDQTPETAAARGLLSLFTSEGSTYPIHEKNEHCDQQEMPSHRESSASVVSEDESVSSCPSANSSNAHEMLPAMSEKGPKVQFPIVLMTLLDEPSNSDVATFMPDGKSFAILKPDVFTKELMPRYFKMTKFTSFVRKLYRWGFRQAEERGKSGAVAYRHPLFRRGELSLCRKIRFQKKENKQPVLIPYGSVGITHPAILPREEHRSVAPVCLQQKQALHPISRPLSPVIQQQSVDDATKNVMEAALHVLNRDNRKVHNTTQERSRATAVDLDQMTLRLLGSSRLGNGTGMLNNGLFQRSNFLLGRPVTPPAITEDDLIRLALSRRIVPCTLDDFRLRMF